MTQSFDDILDESVKFGDSQRVCFEKGFESGQQSKQAEIDSLQQELEAQREETIKGYSKVSDLQLSNDELRKRIDEAIHKLNKLPNNLNYNDAIEAVIILKGNTNED